MQSTGAGGVPQHLLKQEPNHCLVSRYEYLSRTLKYGWTTLVSGIDCVMPEN